MFFWSSVLVVVLVLAALAWWSSGRKGIDSKGADRTRKLNEGKNLGGPPG
ncbi:hypothetical protein [Nocardioides sp. HB32]|jgi:hypothetical protein